MELRDVKKCISCNSIKLKDMFSFVGYQNITFNCLKCKECGLIFSSPMPVLSESLISEIYSSDYYDNYFGNDLDYLNEKSQINIMIKKQLKKEFELFSEFINKKTASKKILDIGCGDGRFLELFHEQGWECYGIEPSDLARKIAQKKGLEVIKTSFLELDSNIRTYDFIIMDNVIEHLDYPNLYLEKIYLLLNKGGIVVLKTPNSSSLFEQLERTFLSFFPKDLILFFLKLLKRRLNIGSGTIHRFGNLHPPVHLAIFNKKSISKALVNVGINLEDIQVYIGSEYYYKWRVEVPKPATFFEKFVKLIKCFGDFLGKGDRLLVITKKR